MESEKGLSVSTLTIQEWICAPSVCGGYTCELFRVDCLKKIVFHIVLQLVAIPEASYAVHNIEEPLFHILLLGSLQYLSLCFMEHRVGHGVLS